MRRAFPVLAGLALLLAPHGPGAAQGGDDLRVEIVVDRSRPAADETVQVTYVFHGTASTGSIKGPPALPLKNLAAIPGWGPATSTQIQFMNGNLQKSVSVSWRLRPLGPGPAEIGETAWTVGDKALKGPPYLLEVGPPRRPRGSSPPGGQAGAAQEDEDPTTMPRPFGAAFPAPRAVQGARGRQEPLVLYLVTPDRTTAYVGEEVVLHYELITQADISGLEYVDPPKFQGVWAEDLEKPDKPEPHRDTYEGQPVTRFTLLRKAVAPLAPGTVTIPAATVRLAVRMAGDPFADPFAFMRPTMLERSTKPITLKVLPIPGRADFKGPVGRFDLAASVDRARISAGEAVTLKVKMSGSGNLRTAVDAPKLEVPSARVYPPTAKTGNTRTAGRPVAQAEWTYVVVPSGPGDFSIPPVRVEVFDPAEKRIVEKATAPIHVLVEGTVAQAAKGAAAAGGAAETLPASDAPLPAGARPGAQAAPAADLSARSAVTEPARPVDLRTGVTIPLWALAAIPAALFVGGGAAMAVRRRLRSRGELASALSPEPGETKERAAGRIDRALRQLLLRRWGIPETAVPSAILEALESAGVPAATREEVRTLQAELDFLRFAPQLGEYGREIDEARKQALRVIRQLS